MQRTESHLKNVTIHHALSLTMGLLSDTQHCELCMHRECRERFPRHRLHRKPLVSDPIMHRGTCVTHVPWCMSGWLTPGCRENVPSIPGGCATRNFAYLVRGPWTRWQHHWAELDTPWHQKIRYAEHRMVKCNHWKWWQWYFIFHWCTISQISLATLAECSANQDNGVEFKMGLSWCCLLKWHITRNKWQLCILWLWHYVKCQFIWVTFERICIIQMKITLWVDAMRDTLP